MEKIFALGRHKHSPEEKTLVLADGTSIRQHRKNMC
jgi:hypothetical protein